jgi:aspartate/methionine/tyrosine aminotransferase
LEKIIMSGAQKAMSSEYMHWAKTRSHARFNLATSGMANLRMADLRASIDDLEITGDTGYGYEPLKEALATSLGVDTDAIVTAAGTSFANHLAMAAIVRPGDEVLMEHPTYEPLLALARYLGADVKRFPRRYEDSFWILPEEVERNITSNTRLIVLTNMHNPSGILADQETLRRVGEIANSVKARILIDEVYLEALFAKRPQTAFHLGPQFITTSSLTKAFGLSGLRCGWIVAEPDLARKIWLLNDLFGATPVHPAERLSVIALKQLDDIAARAESLLEKNRAIVNQFLDSREDLEAVRPGVGTIVFPRLKRGLVENFWVTLKETYETSVVPGSFFEMPSHFRLGFGCESEMLSGGLERLATALDALSRN